MHIPLKKAFDSGSNLQCVYFNEEIKEWKANECKGSFDKKT